MKTQNTRSDLRARRDNLRDLLATHAVNCLLDGISPELYRQQAIDYMNASADYVESIGLTDLATEYRNRASKLKFTNQ